MQRVFVRSQANQDNLFDGNYETIIKENNLCITRCIRKLSPPSGTNPIVRHLLCIQKCSSLNISQNNEYSSVEDLHLNSSLATVKSSRKRALALSIGFQSHIYEDYPFKLQRISCATTTKDSNNFHNHSNNQQNNEKFELFETQTLSNINSCTVNENCTGCVNDTDAKAHNNSSNNASSSNSNSGNYNNANYNFHTDAKYSSNNGNIYSHRTMNNAHSSSSGIAHQNKFLNRTTSSPSSGELFTKHSNSQNVENNILNQNNTYSTTNNPFPSSSTPLSNCERQQQNHSSHKVNEDEFSRRNSEYSFTDNPNHSDSETLNGFIKLMSNTGTLQNSFLLSRLASMNSYQQPQQTSSSQENSSNSDYFGLTNSPFHNRLPPFRTPFPSTTTTTTASTFTNGQQQFIFPPIPQYQLPGFSTLLNPYQFSPSTSSSSSPSFSSSTSSPVSSTINEQSQGILSTEQDLLIHHQFHHLTLEEKKRFEKLFQELDLNHNGYIDFNDLIYALKKKGIKPSIDNVQSIINRQDRNLDGDIDFAEFVNYCLESEQKLHVLFKNIDVNNDGKIDADELINAFKKIGIEVDRLEALRLVSKIKNGKNKQSLELNFDEFRDYLLLHPSNSIQHLLSSWRHGTFVDLGEDGLMPVDFDETEIQTGIWWRHLIAGGIAGAVSRTCTAPLDRIKVFLQVRGAEFKSFINCFKHMRNEGGISSFWRGNGINVLKIAPETALKFMVFDEAKRYIFSHKNGTEINFMERFLAGSFAGAFSQSVIYPMEVIKTRLCLGQTGEYSGILNATKRIFANGGLFNFYRGYVPNLIGIIPYAGIDLAVYETLKKAYMKHNSIDDAPVSICLTCGAISSTFGQIASYPLALVRTRMQTQTGVKRSSMVGMFSNILRTEGPKGFYRGIITNIIKVGPAVAISYSVYERVRVPLGAVMS